MSTTVWSLVLMAAAMHAVWNALVKIEEDRLMAVMLVAIGSSAVAVVGLFFVPLPSPAVLPWLMVSLVVHFLYNVALASAYTQGDFGQVYPVARGIGPVLATLLAAALAGEALTVAEGVAIALIALGVTSLGLRNDAMATGNSRPLFYAVLTGICIAVYSVVDGIGGRQTPNALSYAFWMIAFQCLPITLYGAVVRGPAVVGAVLRRRWRITLIGGALAATAYGIVIWAMSQNAIAPVAALRETSIVFAAVISAWLLREPFGLRRAMATAMVVAGVVLVRLD